MKLSDYLKETSQTHKEFAQKLGITQPQITRIANGTRNPSTLLISKIERDTYGKVTFKDLVNSEIPSRKKTKKK